jgi:hypothetical protein
MTRLERLKIWVDTLDPQKAKEILADCVDTLVDFEYVNFWETSKYPTWDGNGDRLDGLELEDED